MPPDSPRPGSPRYVGIAADLRERIQGEHLGPHTLLPSERELSEQYGVSRMTARQALTLLESEGHVYRRPPRGTFVAEPRFRFRVGSFTEEATRLGRSVTTELVWAREVADGAVAATLGLAAGAALHAFRRLRLIDGEPVALETTYYPAALTPGILAEGSDGSLWQLLRERYGLTLDRTRAVFESVVLDEETCARLRVRSASNGMLLTRTTLDSAGRPVEHARDVYRADRAAFEVTTPIS